MPSVANIINKKPCHPTMVDDNMILAAHKEDPIRPFTNFVTFLFLCVQNVKRIMLLAIKSSKDNSIVAMLKFI
jgi:hypothetical protein